MGDKAVIAVAASQKPAAAAKQAEPIADEESTFDRPRRAPERSFASPPPPRPRPDGRGEPTPSTSPSPSAERPLDWHVPIQRGAMFSPRRPQRSADVWARAAGVQCKLTVGAAGDVYEREADRVADTVMRSPDPGAPALATSTLRIQRACAACDEKDEKAQRKPAGGGAEAEHDAGAMESEIGRLRSGGGARLPAPTLDFMQQRFAHDFSGVRVYAGAQAARSAEALSARAFTVGHDVVFGSGQYAPHSSAGQRLIAHELTHVIQQGASSATPAVQRDEVPDADPLKQPPGKGAAPGAPAPAKSTAPGAKSWKGAAKCGPDFCQPFGTLKEATDDRTAKQGLFTTAIGLAVDSRVVPIWTEYMNGGGAVRSINADFGADFASSKTTARATEFLMFEFAKKLSAAWPSIPAGTDKTYDITKEIPQAVAALDDPKHVHRMNFSVPKEIPGNLAGDIGKDEAANPVGAKPSGQDDARQVTGTINVIPGLSGDLIARPNFAFKVIDTVDLCPGDCGNSTEQIATIPMSRWEATGISGDVPFTVEFSGSTAAWSLQQGSDPQPAPAPPAPAPSQPAPTPPAPPPSVPAPPAAPKSE